MPVCPLIYHDYKCRLYLIADLIFSERVPVEAQRGQYERQVTA
jgi:hypothetical protein